HWRADKYSGDPAYEARMWAVGQVAAARASLELLAHRAGQAAQNGAPWPELAETDCFACHADLRAKSWRQTKAYYKGRTPGNSPHSRWYFALLPALAPLGGGHQQTLADLDRVAASMGKPAPVPERVVQTVRMILPALDKLNASVINAKIGAG